MNEKEKRQEKTKQNEKYKKNMSLIGTQNLNWGNTF
jgi:hypothetical protein